METRCKRSSTRSKGGWGLKRRDTYDEDDANHTNCCFPAHDFTKSIFTGLIALRLDGGRWSSDYRTVVLDRDHLDAGVG